MDRQGVIETSHISHGPHVEVRGAELSGFIPLKFEVHPGNVNVEVSRTSTVLGRHSRADIRLAFPEVSRRHCRIVFSDGVWRIADLNSLNGVFVNGERIHEAVLYSGDRVRIGSCVLTIVSGTPVSVVQPQRQAG